MPKPTLQFLLTISVLFAAFNVYEWYRDDLSSMTTKGMQHRIMPTKTTH